MAWNDLDIEQPSQLIAYLRGAGRLGPAEAPETRMIAGGVSNRTVLVRRTNGEAWVLKQALPKLRVQVDWFSDPARIEREAAGMQWLGKVAPPGSIPDLVFVDASHHLLAMKAVAEPHENWKAMLLDGRLCEEHVTQYAMLLGRMHRAGYDQRNETARVFGERSFFESLRLEPYYGYSAEQVTQAAPFLHALMADTRRRRLTVVHGDYSPKNILVHDDRLILLDHEVIHFGDPGFDIGFALTHLLSKAHHLPDHRDAFARAAGCFWRAYRDTAGDLPWTDDLEPVAVRHGLGCLLARVAGRSPLEYLTPSERERQRAVVLKLMQTPPRTVDALGDGFIPAITGAGA